MNALPDYNETGTEFEELQELKKEAAKSRKSHILSFEERLVIIREQQAKLAPNPAMNGAAEFFKANPHISCE